MAFRIIFAEILSKNIVEDDAYAYTVMRLRQIGNDIAHIQNIKPKKKTYRWVNGEMANLIIVFNDSQYAVFEMNICAIYPNSMRTFFPDNKL